MKLVSLGSFVIWTDTDRPAATMRVTSPFTRERGRVRVAPNEYPASPDQTPHLNPLPLRKRRGEEERSSVRNDKRS